jgi:hypothetical protein
MLKSILAAACLLLSAAAANATPASDCLRTYVDMEAFRNLATAPQAQINWRNVTGRARLGLARDLEGITTVDFMARALEMEKRFPRETMGSASVLGAMAGRDNRALPLLREAVSAREDVVAGRPVYVEQEKLLNAVHGCDVAYGFTPVMNPHSAADEAARIRRGDAAAQSQAAAGLNDVQCAVRFAVAAQSLPAGGGREAMMQKYQAVLQRIQAATPAGGSAQVAADMQREGQELSQLFQSKRMTTPDLVVELNGCETRLGMPVSKFGP